MQDVFQLIKGLSAVDVARRYRVDLRQKGKSYQGICPFHAERDPSFHVHKNRFKCFGCGWSGDAVALVSQLRNVPPLTAAKWIAHDFGIPIDDDNPQARQEARERGRQQAKERDTILFFEKQIDGAAHRLELLIRTTETVLFREGLPAYLELANLVQRLPAWEHLVKRLRGRDVDLRIAALREVRRQDG